MPAPQAPAEIVSFPSSFAWGTSTAAYQIEGGWQDGGKGLSIWDAFSHTPGKVKDGSTGDVAADHLRRFRQDVKLMAQMSLKCAQPAQAQRQPRGGRSHQCLAVATLPRVCARRYYRFSISWSRIIPAGTGPVNPNGIRFYSGLIDELIKHGIHPVATLYHWDLPLPLQIENDGWLSHKTANAFVAYARVCFERFGDRVKHWITLNEPANHAVYGYARGDHAPGRTVAPNKEPYIAVHYMLLAHAHASAIYRQSFQPAQKGILSIALNADWREPLDSSAGALAASQRSLEFTLGWLADPLYFGDYPAAMRKQLGARLPSFTAEQRRLLLNSTDFFALQHYSSLLVSERAEEDALPADNFYSDEMVNHHSVPGAKKNMLNWDIAPFGMEKLAKWIHRRYAPAGGIVVTENGLPLREDSAEQARHDAPRTCYIKQYLQALARAMRDGVDVRGYFAWSLIDNVEWAEGVAPRFGLVYVDWPTQKRVPKGSAAFFARLAQTGSFSITPAECNASVATAHRFKTEAAELQALVNRSADEPKLSAEQTLAVATRTARLALLAEMQARYDAEQGEFELMRYWLEKGQKLRTGAKRQQQLSRQKAAKQEEERRRQREQEQQREQQQEQQQEQLGLGVEAAEAAEAGGLVSEDELLMSLPGEADGELAAAMAADSERAAASGLPSAAAAVPSGLGLGAGRLGADGAGDRADATPPEELQELQPAPVEEDEEVQRATAAGLQAAVVVTPLDNEEL